MCALKCYHSFPDAEDCKERSTPARSLSKAHLCQKMLSTPLMLELVIRNSTQYDCHPRWMLISRSYFPSDANHWKMILLFHNPSAWVQTIISLMKTRWLYSIHGGLMFPRQLTIAFSPGWIIKTCIIALHSIQKMRSISIDMEHYAKK